MREREEKKLGKLLGFNQETFRPSRNIDVFNVNVVHRPKYFQSSDR